MKPPCARRDRSGSIYINAIRYWGAPVPKTNLASNRVHVSVPRAQDRNHIAGVTFHVFSGKEEYCKYEYERFRDGLPRHGMGADGNRRDTEALATIASAFAARNAGRRPGKTTSPHTSTRVPVSRGRENARRRSRTSSRTRIHHPKHLCSAFSWIRGSAGHMRITE